MLFSTFAKERIKIKAGELVITVGGNGPPLLLVHGNPQTHAMWHFVAPVLAERFTVICADLRGYGQSFKPPASDTHEAYSKRSMSTDLVQLMVQLGYESFQIAGHDRGARVAHRLAIDFPELVTRLALLDIIPTLEHFERTDMQFAMGYYHWFWLAQPCPIPETLINANPVEWFFSHTAREPKKRDFFHPEALQDYLQAVKTPEMITGMCEDYRAAASIDLEHDRTSRSNADKVNCPVLILWGNKGKIGQWYDPMAIWREYVSAAYCGDIVGGPVNSGHYLAEECPEEVLAYFADFFRHDS